MTHIVKGDQVLVRAGNHKGLSGEVLRIDGDRVVVQGINVRKKHVKPTRENPKGSILQIERAIHISNVALLANGKAVRLHSKVESDGSKVLYFKDGASESTHRVLKKAASK